MPPCTNVITTAKVGHGFLVCTRTVYGSTISTRSIGAKKVAPRSFPWPPARRSRLHFADSASKSSPLWNLTPLRSLTSQRSEEHTSELQSPCNLVCRLLLEKKKNKRHNPMPLSERSDTAIHRCII